jgi:DNA-binding protein H-NS
LLKDPLIPEADKAYIKNLLTKPWNPYVQRHSALTAKSRILKETTLRDHAGWSMTSKMPNIYLHYFGNESSKSLLEAYGVEEYNQQQIDILKAKTCSNCMEPNKPDAQFCFKCNFVMSFEAYHKTMEEKERNDQELRALRNEQQIMKEHMARVEESQLKITELLEVMKIAKSRDGKLGKDRTMLDDERRVTIGYVDDNNQRVEMKVPLDGFQIDEAGVDAVT